MAKVALKISNLSDADAAAKAANAVNNCIGNQLANPTPPEVAALHNARVELDSARANQIAKDQAAKAATELKTQKRAALETAYAALGDKVQTVSAGDAAIITARGFDVVVKGGPVLMTQVLNVVTTPGDSAGELDWMCAPQKGAMYLLETSPDVEPRVWTKQEPSKKSSGSIAGLPVTSRVWLRVAAKGSHNTGGWSDPALVIVP